MGRISHRRRRVCCSLVGFATYLAFPLPAALADTRAPQRIIILESLTLPGVQARTEAVRRHLGDFGYRLGIDLQFTVINANTDRARGARLLREEIAHQKPALVVSVATLASQAARDVLKGSDIPQVFLFVTDPVGNGLVPALDAPSGSNITGHVHTFSRKVYLDTLDRLLLVKAGSRPTRIGLLTCDYPASVSATRDLMALATKSPNLSITPVEIKQRPMPSEVPAMLEEARTGLAGIADAVDFLWIAEGPLGRDVSFLEGVLTTAPKPVVMGPSMAAARLGALAALDGDPDMDGREAARTAHAILNGEKASAIPVMRNQVFRIGLNAGTAKRLGIAIPPDMATMAGDHLYP